MTESKNEKLDGGIEDYFRDPENVHLSVLIEIKLPQPTFRPPSRSVGEPLKVEKGTFMNVPSKDETQDIVNSAKEVLESTLNKTLVWIESSGVFVTELTEDEIQSVRSMEFVKYIHRNREHGASKSDDEIGP